MSQRIASLMLIAILISLPAAWGGSADVRPAPNPAPVQSKVKTQLAHLSSPDPVERVKACWKLYRLGEAAAPAVPALISLLGDETEVPGNTIPADPQGYPDTPPVTPAQIAAWALSSIGKAAVNPLTAVLRDPEFRGRARAMLALGAIDDPRTRETLLASLKDADPKVRANAVASLGKIHRGRAAPPPSRELAPVMVTMASDADAEVRTNALAALSRMRDVRAMPVFLAHLTDPEAPVRAEAARGLAFWDEPRAVPLLIGLLQDQDAEVRAAAA